MRSMDLRALEIFRAVALEGSVTKAAMKLNCVQSNISTRVKQLEQHLEKSLFHRRNRGLTLTPDGRLLLSYADRLLELSREAAEALNEGQPSGVFRIGTMESTAAARLPEVLSRYHRLYPDVRIELETDTAGGLMDRLANHDIEIAFAAEPIDFEDFETRPVYQEELVMVAPPSFPSLDNPSEISGRTVIAFKQGCAYRRYLDDWLLNLGIVPGGIIAMGSYLGILACVSAGTGFAIVPRCVLDTVLTNGEIEVRPLSKELSRVKTLMAWRSDYRSVKLDALEALLPAP